MNKIPFVNMFSQSATGLSINGDDLIITSVCKKLVKYAHETFRIKDFMHRETQQLKHMTIQKKKFAGEIILSLPRELTIIREIDYPNINVKELKEALRYQLDSFIPFGNNDVYFDIHASFQRSSNNTKVLIVAVKKIELDHLLSRLQAIEIIPTRVIISSFAFIPMLGEKRGIIALIGKNANNYTYNLFENNHLALSSIVKTEAELTTLVKRTPPDEILSLNVNNGFLQKEHKVPLRHLHDYSESYGAALYGVSDYPCTINLIKPQRKRLNAQVSLMCFLVGFVIFFTFLISYIQKTNNIAILNTINTQVKSIKKDVSIVEKLQERIAILDDAVASVNEIRGKYIPRIDVILELAKVLPSDSWAKAISIVDNTLEIEGDAVSSTNLIPILENSPLFSGVGLSSPVTKTQSGREKYRISGNIEK